MPHDDFLTRKQVADLYPIPYSTLKKLSMRNAKGGPPVIRLGDRVLYHVPAFEKWLTSFMQSSGGAATKPRGRPRKQPQKSEQVAAARG